MILMEVKVMKAYESKSIIELWQLNKFRRWNPNFVSSLLAVIIYLRASTVKTSQLSIIVKYVIVNS